MEGWREEDGEKRTGKWKGCFKITLPKRKHTDKVTFFFNRMHL